jgi:hypothetical protein
MLAKYKNGDYEKLFKDKNISSAFRIINSVTKKLGFDYFIIGGAAVYLHIKNPPTDYPDIDIFLNTDKYGARLFYLQITKKGFKGISFDEEWNDSFMRLKYKTLDFEIFTSQEETQYLNKPIIIKGMKVKPIESLIIEKLIRSSYEDILMAIDLLTFKKYNKTILKSIARDYLVTGRLIFLINISSGYLKGKLKTKDIRKIAEKLSR